MNLITQTVSFDLIQSFLDARSLNVTEESPSSWSMVTENALYLWTLENPDVLQIRGQWRGVATNDEDFSTLRGAIARCNATRLSPKAYVLTLEDGKSHGLMAECNVLTAGGLSEQQFYGFCESSLTAMMSLFIDLERRHPELLSPRRTA